MPLYITQFEYLVMIVPILTLSIFPILCGAASFLLRVSLFSDWVRLSLLFAGSASFLLRVPLLSNWCRLSWRIGSASFLVRVSLFALQIVPSNFLHIDQVLPLGLSCFLSSNFDVHCLTLLSPFAIDGSIKSPSAV